MLARAAACCVLAGLVLALVMQHSPAPGTLLWSWLSGALLAACLVPALRWGPQLPLGLFAVLWPALAFVGGASVPVSEPQTAPADLAIDVLACTLLAALLAGSRDAFRLYTKDGPAPARPGAWRVAETLAACGLAYLALYYLVGSVLYAVGLTAAPAVGGWFPLIHLGRGVLVTVACLPMVFALRIERSRLALTLALLLWVVGGLAPLLVPNPYRVLEALLQNAPIGLLAGRLLGRATEPALVGEVAAGA